MHSFVECLRSVCRDVKPRRIIEWGPGKSTAVLREECGDDAIIISVEHNPQYAKIARETNHANHVFEFDAACYKSRYAVWPLHSFDKDQRFDLAFVDGRRRVECALVAWMLLRKGGALVMHDAHRWHYSLVMRHYLGEPEGGAYAVDRDTSVWVKGKNPKVRGGAQSSDVAKQEEQDHA